MELAFDDAVSYTQQGNQLEHGEMYCSTAKCSSSDWDSYPCRLGHLPRTLTTCAISPPPEEWLTAAWLSAQEHTATLQASIGV